MSRRWNRPAVLAACVTVSCGLVFAACGGSGGSGSASDTKTATNGKIDVDAKDPFSFDVKTINASPGPLTVTLHEKGSQTHTFTMSSPKFELTVKPDHTEATGTVN